MDRPELFSQAVVDKICERLPAEPLTTILADEKMPGYSTVMRWLHENPEFRENYARAREVQGDYDADTVVEIRNKLLAGEITPEVARVATDSCKWTAGVRKPKVYGPRLAVDHDVTGNLAERLKSARERRERSAGG